MERRRRLVSDALTFGVVFGLLLAVYLLPPDTSLVTVRNAGILRVCVPEDYPPLVMDEPDAPGIDIELLREVAHGLGVRLVLSPNTAISQSFNPRGWGLNRAQCEVIAGGVVASPTTRSFVDTTPPHATTSWALVGPNLPDDIENKRVGVLPSISGLDRIALSGYLRERGVAITVVSSQQALVDGLVSGALDVGITERLLAGHIATEKGWAMATLSDDLAVYPVVFGLWKGDLTLKRSIVRVLNDLQREGKVDEIVARYVAAEPPSRAASR